MLNRRYLISGWQGSGIRAGCRKAKGGTHRKQEQHVDGYICIFAFVETHAIKFSRSIFEQSTLSSAEFEGILCCSFSTWNKILLEATFCSWSIGNHNIKEVCCKGKCEITPGKPPSFLPQKQSERLYHLSCAGIFILQAYYHRAQGWVHYSSDSRVRNPVAQKGRCLQQTLRMWGRLYSWSFKLLYLSKIKINSMLPIFL